MANDVLELAHHRAGLELGLLSPDSELEEHGNNEGRVPHEQLKYSIRVTRLAVPVWARCQTRKAFAFAGRRLAGLVGACGRTVTTIPAAVATTTATKREGTAGLTRPRSHHRGPRPRARYATINAIRAFQAD